MTKKTTVRPSQTHRGTTETHEVGLARLSLLGGPLSFLLSHRGVHLVPDRVIEHVEIGASLGDVEDSDASGLLRCLATVRLVA